MQYPEALRTEVLLLLPHRAENPDGFISHMRDLTNAEYRDIAESYFGIGPIDGLRKDIMHWLIVHDLYRSGDRPSILNRKRLYEIGKALALSTDPDTRDCGVNLVLKNLGALPITQVEQITVDLLNLADGPLTHLHGNPFTCTLMRKYGVPAAIAVRVPLDSPDNEPCACQLHKMKRAVSPVVPA